MNDHPDGRALERFVLGALDAGEVDGFVAHVSSCDACAAKLAGEARLELVLVETRAAMPRTRASHTRAGARNVVWLAVPAALAAAAAIALMLRSKPPLESRQPAPSSAATPAAASPIPNVVCPDGMDQQKCVQEAHRHGLYVQYPEWGGAPPLGGGRSSGSGPAGSPFPVSYRAGAGGER